LDDRYVKGKWVSKHREGISEPFTSVKGK